MANIFSPITDEWRVVNTSRDAARRVIAVLFATVGTVALTIFLGGMFVAFGGKAALVGRDIAHEFAGSPPRFTAPDNALIVRAGVQDHVSKGFAALIDLNKRSPTYGKVLSRGPLTGASAVGNEPDRRARMMQLERADLF
jgi:hypothetical protein